MIVQEWLEQLAPRERLMVIGCGIFVVLALIWTLGIRPLYTNSALLELRVAEKQAQLASLYELASTVRPGQSNAGPSPQQGRAESIVVVIDRTTRSRQLASYLKRNQPEGDASVRLRLEGAPFDVLVEWIGELQQTYGMTATNASIDQAGPGRVNCSITLTRGGG